MARYGLDGEFNLNHDVLEPTTPKHQSKPAMQPTQMVDGLYLATPLLLGVAIGLGFDRFFDTKPWGLLGFLLAGTLSSFYNMFVLIRSTRNTAK